MDILVIEDSPRLRKSLVVGMTRLGHTASGAGDGEEGLALALSEKPDMVILDIMLPGMDGLSVLSRIREVDHESIVILLTAKDQIQDRVNGLNRGADDYLCKPFSFSELEARVNALNRRAHIMKSPVLSLGELVLDMNRKEVQVAGEEVRLTPTEFVILEHLLLSRGRVVSYETLQNLVHTEDSLSGQNVIEAHVSGIRKKIKKFSDIPVVSTKRGFGYIVK